VARHCYSDDALVTSDDTELASGLVARLGASATTESSRSLPAPEENGCYFCGACVDSAEGEAATANNCSRPVEILVGEGPDFEDGAPARLSFSE